MKKSARILCAIFAIIMVASCMVVGTGASSATISRVNKCLLYGSGGYATALQRLSEEKENG